MRPPLQLVTPADTAFFSFSCALPGEPPETGQGQGPLSASTDTQTTGSGSSSASGASGTVTDPAGSSSGSSSSGEGDAGWEIQEGGECTYFYALDGANFSMVLAPSLGSSSSYESGANDSSGGLAGATTNALLLTGLDDGQHELW